MKLKNTFKQVLRVKINNQNINSPKNNRLYYYELVLGGKMQRIMSFARTFTSLVISKPTLEIKSFSAFRTPAVNERLLSPFSPLINPSCGFKVKGYVRRRCQSCYIVVRDSRIYNICPKYPRHKQMSMKPKPHNTWILTHATQSKVRPW